MPNIIRRICPLCLILGMLSGVGASAGWVWDPVLEIERPEAAADVVGPIAAHAALTTGVHGAGASTLATVAQLPATDAAANVGSLRTLGTGATQALPGNTTIPAAQDAVTLATSADTLLGLTGQALSLDTQAANLVFAGRADAGTALAPTFRALVAADIPALSYEPVIGAAVDWGGKTSVEIPNGSGPTLSAVGQIALDTTQNQLLLYAGSAAAVYASPTKSVSFTILYNGTSWANLAIPIWQAPLSESVTITTIDATTMGTASPVLAYNLEERAYASLASAGTDVIAADASADADGTETTSFANAGVASKAHLVFTTGATPDTGTVTAITVTVYYTVDRL